LIVILGAAACGPDPRSAPTALLPVTLPDVAPLHAAVQQQLRDGHAALQTALGRDTGAPLGEAFGRFGMLLQAADFLDAATPAYRNAQTLMPADIRWPYYLAHLHKDQGDIKASEAAFTRVLELKPDDLATLIWLGRLYLDDGRPDEAQRLFERAGAQAADSIAVLAGLGRSALARKDLAAAITHFERALQLDPSAESLHAPLAAAYRATGAHGKAEPHLREWQNRDILVPDPLNQEIDMLLESGLAYELRGVRALESQDFASAAEYFRRGLKLTPDTTPLGRSLRHKLGTALFATGQEDAAVAEFRQVVAAAPEGAVDEASGKAHYSLGVVATARGDTRDAVRSFRSAVKFQPAYIEAHIALGETLRRSGQVGASLPSYEEALRLQPQSAQARWGHALALVSMGRHREAVRWLDTAAAMHPERPEFRHLLARVLAASPDALARDGARATAIVEELLKGQKTVELGETLAMALAENGDYAQAAAIQRGVLQTVRRGGQAADAIRLEAGLRMYELRRPLRSVWVGEQADPPAPMRP
jgi:tetratricopeptide (TPR) repeat protein